LGDRSRAESEIAQALQLSPENADVRWMAVLTYEALGRREFSLSALSGASREFLADMNRWPDVSDLQRDPRFVQILISNGVQ
jgi:hypothetical protein